jgi:hypothetical protein
MNDAFILLPIDIPYKSATQQVLHSIPDAGLTKKQLTDITTQTFIHI